MDNKKTCENFLQLITNGDYQNAFGSVKQISVLGDNVLDNLMVQTQSQIEMIKPRFGQILGHEFLKENSLNETLVKYTYVLKFEYMLLVFDFTFYKPKDKYVIIALNWSDDFKVLFN